MRAGINEPEVIESGSTIDPNWKVVSVEVLGDNDTNPDLELTASPTPNLQWSNTGANGYQVRVFDPNGVSLKCGPYISTLPELDLTNCGLDDYSQYEVGISPLGTLGTALLSLESIFQITTKKLRLNIYDSTIFPGESVDLRVFDGEPPYVVVDSGSGYLNTVSLNYTVDVQTSLTTDTIAVTDNRGANPTVNLRIRKFEEVSKIEGLPFTTDFAGIGDAKQTLAGTIIAGGTNLNDAGENWMIHRSVDGGQTFSIVDYIHGTEIWGDEGYVHGVAISPIDDAIYVCGALWLDSSGNLEWLTRKSTDQGLTWSSVQNYSEASGDTYCYDIDIDSAGNIFTVGEYLGTPWVVKMSADNGATWTDIGTNASGTPMLIEVDPYSGNLWVIGTDKVQKGVFNAGSWTWTTVAFPGRTTFSISYGSARSEHMVFKSATEFYFFDKGVWRSTDSGATWVNEVLFTGNNTGGMALAADGGVVVSYYQRDILGGGSSTRTIRTYKRSPIDSQWYVLNIPDPDNGTNLNGEGPVLFNLQNGDLAMIGRIGSGCHRYGKSSDSGSTWIWGGYLCQRSTTYSSLNYFEADDKGKIWSIFELADPTGWWGWAAASSVDGGNSWVVNSSYFDNPDDQCWGSPVAWDNDSVGHYYYGTDEWSSTPDCFYRSSNFGVTLIKSIPAPVNGVQPEIRKIVSLSNSEVLIFLETPGKQVIRKSTDYGATWNDLLDFSSLSLGGPVNFVDLATFENQLWMIIGEGANSRIYRSVDNANSWSLVESWNNIIYQDLMVGGDDGLYVWVGNPGEILKWDGSQFQKVLEASEFGSFDYPAIDHNGKIYLQTGSEIFTKSNFSNSWIMVTEMWWDSLDRYDYSDYGNMVFSKGNLLFPTRFISFEKETEYMVRGVDVESP